MPGWMIVTIICMAIAIVALLINNNSQGQEAETREPRLREPWGVGAVGFSAGLS